MYRLHQEAANNIYYKGKAGKYASVGRTLQNYIFFVYKQTATIA